MESAVMMDCSMAQLTVAEKAVRACFREPSLVWGGSMAFWTCQVVRR